MLAIPDSDAPIGVHVGKYSRDYSQPDNGMRVEMTIAGSHNGERYYWFILATSYDELIDLTLSQIGEWRRDAERRCLPGVQETSRRVRAIDCSPVSRRDARSCCPIEVKFLRAARRNRTERRKPRTGSRCQERLALRVRLLERVPRIGGYEAVILVVMVVVYSMALVFYLGGINLK